MTESGPEPRTAVHRAAPASSSPRTYPTAYDEARWIESLADLLSKGRSLERRGIPFPTESFRRLAATLIESDDLSGLDRVVSVGEALARSWVAREQELDARLAEIASLRTWARRLGRCEMVEGVVPIDPRTDVGPRAPGDWDRALATSAAQAERLRSGLIASLLAEARDLAGRLSQERPSEEVAALSRARSVRLLRAARDGDLSSLAGHLNAMRDLVQAPDSPAGLAIGPSGETASPVADTWSPGSRHAGPGHARIHTPLRPSASSRAAAERPVPFRYGRGGRRPPSTGRRLIRGAVHVSVVLLVVLAAYSAVANAHASSTPTISVTGLAPQTIGVGQTATVTASIADGVPISAASGSFSGYLVYFFYGQTDAAGGVGYDHQIVPAPNACQTADQACSAPAQVTFTHRYDRPGSYDVSLTVYDAVGNYAIATEVVNVLPPTVLVHAASNVSSAAEDTPIAFSASVTTAPTSYESDTFAYWWDFGDNNTTWGPAVSHAYVNSGNYVVTVRAYDNQTGAVNQTTLSDLVITNPAPVPVLSVRTPTSVTNTFSEDQPISFSAADSRDVPTDRPHLRYLWDFGDGVLGSGISATHTYTESGTYTVTLTVLDEEDRSASAQTVLTIDNPGPVANTSATSSAPVPVGTVAVLNASNSTDVPTDLPLENYTWSSTVSGVTDQNNTSGLLGRQAYFQPGSFVAGLSLADEQGGYSSATVPITVVDTPPNVGVDSMYTLANLTLAVKGTPGNTLNLSVWESGRWVAGGLLTRSAGNPALDVLTLHDVALSLSDSDSITITYVSNVLSPPRGANPVDLTVSFWGDGPSCLLSYASSVCSPLAFSHIFTAQRNSTYPWTVSGNAASVGKLVFVGAQVFSPARTNLSTVWSFGDGATASSATPVPSIAEPTLAAVSTQHRWLPGSDYVFTSTVRDAWGLSTSSTVVVGEIGNATVSAIAPKVVLTTPTSMFASSGETLTARVTSEQYAQGSFDLNWQFGDGRTDSAVGTGPEASVVHYYALSATRYALIVYASAGPGLPRTAAWSLLTVENERPLPSFVAPGPTVREGVPIVFDASASRDYGSSAPGANLTFAWTFGDGSTGGDLRGAGDLVTHTFSREGTFPVTLTVTDLEGLSASLTQNITVSDVAPTVQLSPRTVTVDEFASFSPAELSGDAYDVAGFSGTWSWGDGLANGTGLTSGHTYLLPGTYTPTLTLSDDDGTTVASATGQVRVIDQPFTVSLPYDGFTVYGENHTATFTASVLGSAADRLDPSANYTYVWSFGDGTPNVTTYGHLSGSVQHVYSMSGNPVLTVTVIAPDGRTAGTSATLICVPNWDGDGIPNEYATLMLHTNPGNDPSHGTGLTDFMAAFVVGGLNQTADTDHDGLTDFQEVFGTVTGYVTNPLDPSTAGDGMLDGSHKFVDSFHSTQVVQFNGTGSLVIPGVQHPGDLAAVSSVQLYDEIVSSDPSALSVSLSEAGGTPVSLGSPSSPVQEYTLLNNSPVNGSSSSYGLALSQFVGPTDWTLSVSGGAGSIESAQILVTYYTNPNLADPYHSGLTLGSGFSIPVYNCTEPTNANYTVFNGRTFSYSTVFFYPYTEQYWKLSVVQGLPYYPWDNASYAQGSAPGCTVQDPHAFATYYGDRQFGLPPWSTHYAEAGLTNGMKAYGRQTYDLTANHYLDASTGQYVSSETTPYPYDTLSYGGPLNPTAYSTGTTGVADSQSIDPVGGPRVLGVSVGSAWSNCVDQGFAPAGIHPKAEMGITDVNWPNSPTLFAAEVNSNNDNYNAKDVCTSWHFTWNMNYQVPLTTSSTTAQITLGVYFTNAATDSYGGSTTFTVSTTDTGPQVMSQDGYSATFRVFSLTRMPVVLFNATNEVQNIPGYGLRWVGDQHVYAFYVNLNDSGAGTPFHAGQNLLLVSRTAFVNSSLNRSLAQGTTSAYPFLQGASLSTPGATSVSDLLGTMSVTLNSSEANALLAGLVPHNASGDVMGSYTALSQTQFELLGFSGAILQSAPYFPFSTAVYSATSAPVPQSVLQKIGNFLSSVWNAIVSVAIAIGNFIASIAEKIGQAIVGLWNQAVAAVKAAVNALVSAFDFILKWIEQKVDSLFNTIKDKFETWIGKAIEAVILPILSLLVGFGVIGLATFNATFQTIDQKFNLTDPAPLSNGSAGQEISTFVEVFTGVHAAIFAMVGMFMYLIDIVSLGTAAAETEAASASASGLVVGVVASVFGAVAGAAGIFGVLTAIVPAFGGNDPFSNFFSYLNNNATGQLGSNIAQIVVTFLAGVTDLIKTLVLSSLSGAYIVGLALGIVSLLASVIAALFTNPLPTLVLGALGLVLAVASVVVQLYPTTQAADDASETGIADAAGIVLGISGALLGISTLTEAAVTCAQNTTACAP